MDTSKKTNKLIAWYLLILGLMNATYLAFSYAANDYTNMIWFNFSREVALVVAAILILLNKGVRQLLIVVALFFALQSVRFNFPGMQFGYYHGMSLDFTIFQNESGYFLKLNTFSVIILWLIISQNCRRSPDYQERA